MYVYYVRYVLKYIEITILGTIGIFIMNPYRLLMEYQYFQKISTTRTHQKSNG